MTQVSLARKIFFYYSKLKIKIFDPLHLFLILIFNFSEFSTNRALSKNFIISEVDVEEKYIYLNQDEINWAKEKMLDKGISNPVALFPFSVSSSRTFPEDKIKEWFSDSKEQYVIFGSESDEKKAEEMIAKNKNISMQSLCGKYDLRKSVALIAVCNYAFAADSGLGHISSILGIPTVSFFGAGRSSVTKPIGKYNVAIDKSTRCKPCKKNICCLNAIKKSDVNYAIKFLQIDSKFEVQ